MSEEDKKAASIVLKIRSALVVMLMVLTKLLEKLFNIIAAVLVATIILVTLGVSYQLSQDTAIQANVSLIPMLDK